MRLWICHRDCKMRSCLCLAYLYVRPSKLTFMTAGASAPHVGVSVAFQSGSRRSQNSQCVSRLRAAQLTLRWCRRAAAQPLSEAPGSGAGGGEGGGVSAKLAI